MKFSFNMLGYRISVGLTNPPTWQSLSLTVNVVQRPVIVSVGLNVLGMAADVEVVKIVADGISAGGQMGNQER